MYTIIFFQNFQGLIWFQVTNDYNTKWKKSEKRDKYQYLARELKKKKQQQWNMKVTVIPIVSGALGTVTKRLVQGLEHLEIRGRVETIQTTALSLATKILRRVLEA